MGGEVTKQEAQHMSNLKNVCIATVEESRLRGGEGINIHEWKSVTEEFRLKDFFQIS